MWRAAFSRIGAVSGKRFATTQSPPKIPLNVALPGFEKEATTAAPSRISSTSTSDPFDAELTKLDNGLRIATQPCHGDFVTIGLAIESGCRYEAGYTAGTAHFLEKLAFSSTGRRTSEEIFAALDASSAIIDCQSTRDTTIYAASCHRSGVEEILEIIADAALRPSLLEEEIEACRETLVHENTDMRQRIECEPLMTDWLHQAAFRHNTLGFPKYTPAESTSKITRDEVVRFQRTHHTPSRMVLAAVGVDHDELVGLAGRCFVPNTTEVIGARPADASVAQYTGGEIREKADLSAVGAGTPYPLLAHVALGFEGASYKDEDFVAFCVLQSLLGGGNSFSAGGPGKGMYTRMYTDVLNHHHWMYGCQAFNHSYADAGIFAIHAACPPEGTRVTLHLLVDQFLRLEQGAEKEELERAKTQLKSQLLMNLEVRPVMFEDIARQVIGHGYRRKPTEYMAKIDAIGSDDIKRVGQRMLNGRPSLVGYGDLQHLPSYEDLDEAIARRNAGMLMEPKKKYFKW